MRTLPVFLFLVACNPGALATNDGRDLGGDGSPPDLGPTCDRKADTPARASLRIVVENHAAEARFLAVPSPTQGFSPSGPNCAPFAVRAAGATTPLGLVAGFQCVCECPAPPAPHVDRYRKLAPGESFELGVWDGRAQVDCAEQVDCAKRGWQGVDDEHVLHAEPQPTGTYVVTLGFANTPPPQCTSSDGIDHVCQSQGGGGTSGLSVTLSLCPTTRTASAEGTLAESGETTVSVALD